MSSSSLSLAILCAGEWRAASWTLEVNVSYYEELHTCYGWQMHRTAGEACETP